MSWLKRILLDSLMLICIIFTPWYIPAVLGIVIFWKYSLSEIIFFGMIMDILFDSPHNFKIGMFPMLTFTVSAAIIMIVITKLKEKIR